MRDKGERFDWTEGNELRLLQNGADFFPALCKAINGAQESVHVETYIFRLDHTGFNVLECLENAARRGVKVHLVLDGFGSQQSAAWIAACLLAAGGQCRIYRPEPRWLAWLIPAPGRLRRMHRKIAVIDAKVALIGGINIIDDYAECDPRDATVAPRLDFAVEISGPLVAYVVQAQNLMWMQLNRGLRDRLQYGCYRRGSPVRHESRASIGAPRAALLLRDNMRHRRTFERAYLYGLRYAKHHILIANAYFLPGRRFRKALAKAAMRGVVVRLLLQGKVEYPLQHYATQSLYGQLLRSGVKIYEYMPGYLHAKVAVIDDILTVGSSNLDPFSLLLAREANVLVHDVVLARELQQRLEAAIAAGGRLVRQVEYRHRGWIERCLSAVAYTLLRIGVALTGRSGQY